MTSVRELPIFFNDFFFAGCEVCACTNGHEGDINVYTNVLNMLLISMNNLCLCVCFVVHYVIVDVAVLVGLVVLVLNGF